jgi:hypothetical protein
LSLSQSGRIGANLQSALLLAAVLAMTGLGLILATARSGVMGQDHIVAAVAPGLTPGLILRRHILRNTLIPVLTLLAIGRIGICNRRKYPAAQRRDNIHHAASLRRRHSAIDEVPRGWIGIWLRASIWACVTCMPSTAKWRTTDQSGADRPKVSPSG